MKTKKYSLSMKTALMAVVVSFAFSAFVQAQFTTPVTAIVQVPDEEVRTGQTGTYNVNLNDNDGDQYRWAVVGGTITVPAGATTSGADTSVIEFLPGTNVSEITVQWNADLSADPVGSAPGVVLVQKLSSSGGCASTIQQLDMTQWNNVTAAIDDTGLPTAICSGEAVGGVVAVNLTGSPNATADGFQVIYTITANNLTDLDGNTWDGSNLTELDNDELLEIALPDELINTGTSDETFTLTITQVRDDFDDGGTIIVGSESYSITVYATPETGIIVSTGSLTR